MRDHIPPAQSKTLYVTGFPSDMRAKKLADYFKPVGQIRRCDIPAVRYGKNPYAFVEYNEVKDTETALETLNNIPVGDGTLHIEYAKKPPRAEWDSQPREPRRDRYDDRRGPRDYGRYGRRDDYDYDRRGPRDYDRYGRRDDYDRRDYDHRPRYYDDRERSPRRSYRRSPPRGRDVSIGGRSPANGNRYGRGSRYSRSASPNRERGHSPEPSKRAPPNESGSGEGRRSVTPPPPAPAPQQDDLDVAE